MLDTSFRPVALTGIDAAADTAVQTYIEFAYFAVEYRALDLARLFGGTRQSIEMYWLRGRRAGRLPPGLRRLLDITTDQAIEARGALYDLWPREFPALADALFVDDDDDEEDEFGGVATDALALELGLRPGDDPVLLKLIAAHGHERRRDTYDLGPSFLGVANAARMRAAPVLLGDGPAAIMVEAWF